MAESQITGYIANAILKKRSLVDMPPYLIFPLAVLSWIFAFAYKIQLLFNLAIGLWLAGIGYLVAVGIFTAIVSNYLRYLERECLRKLTPSGKSISKELNEGPPEVIEANITRYLKNHEGRIKALENTFPLRIAISLAFFTMAIAFIMRYVINIRITPFAP